MNTADIIDQLGGTVAAAAALKLSKQTVSNWKKSGIPPKWWNDVCHVAKAMEREDITIGSIQSARRLDRGMVP